MVNLRNCDERCDSKAEEVHLGVHESKSDLHVVEAHTTTTTRTVSCRLQHYSQPLPLASAEGGEASLTDLDISVRCRQLQDDPYTAEKSTVI